MDGFRDPGNSVSNGFKNNDTAKPSVNQVHRVKRDAGQLDDWIVAPGQEEKRDHVDDSHNAGTGDELAGTFGVVAVVNPPEAEADVDTKVANEEECLQPAR